MLLIKAKKIYTLGAEFIEDGTMLVEDGKIVEIGTNLTVDSNMETLDFGDKIIMPGLIDPHTHLGVWGDGEGAGSHDGNEWTSIVRADVRVWDSINIKQMSFKTALEGGITTVQVLPGSSNAIGGTCCVLKTKGDTLEDMLIKKHTGLKGALGHNVKRRHGQLQNHGGATRMGIASTIRDYFNEVKAYQVKKEQAEENSEKFKIELKYESGLKVLNKEMPFRVHAHRHDDIATAIRICDEYGIDYSIEHCTDGHLIKDYVGSKESYVTLGPGLSSSGKNESANYTDENPMILHKAGAKVSLTSDHPFLNIRYFMHYGAIVHKSGMSKHETLLAMTMNPATALGISDCVGSLEAGKDCDFVVLGGEPFTLKGRVEKTFINGNIAWERD